MPPRKRAAKKATPKDPTPTGERSVTTKAPTQKETLAAEKPDDGPGYFGETPDDTPNENYTVSGVLAGKPVPEVQE